ncbi:MAG: SDR family oxidoreductase [Oceanibaculum nanhaiense]|uniref:SDR family oxidoreductase n=1 Tax=Oceanibaculum nanhaiense TaxID=1909734 RepID=UPI0025A37127|nr:SDR family oxidoreductase [Oceanibaculum nanhaiense]MDM7947918.1 SDR family oxidoreductase [Oceanibaculum nanhaiense]
MTRPGSLFCFGFGYSAEWLAAKLLPQGWKIAGTARDDAKRAAMQARGITAYPFPLPDAGMALAGVTHILSSVPPRDGHDPVVAAQGDALRVLPDLAWAGYLSTTGVYGDTGGAWVDEDSPLNPSTPSGKARVTAEAEWQALNLPLHIFRLSGIYGPGRSAIDQLRAGTAKRIVKPGQVFNRIHVEDIAQVLAASMARPAPGAIYNLADDEPAASSDVVLEASRLLGVAPPPEIPLEQADLGAMGRAFYSESKRVRNDRIKRDLGIRLTCPTYREGLAACLARPSSN